MRGSGGLRRGALFADLLPQCRQTRAQRLSGRLARAGTHAHHQVHGGDLALMQAEGLADDAADARSEEHTSELQSPCNIVCRLLLEKKKKKRKCTRVHYRFPREKR